MNAASVQMRDEIVTRLHQRLGLPVVWRNVSVYPTMNNCAALTFSIGRISACVTMPWSDIRDRHLYYCQLEALVLARTLSLGIYHG